MWSFLLWILLTLIGSTILFGILGPKWLFWTSAVLLWILMISLVGVGMWFLRYILEEF